VAIVLRTSVCFACDLGRSRPSRVRIFALLATCMARSGGLRVERVGDRVCWDMVYRGLFPVRSDGVDSSEAPRQATVGVDRIRLSEVLLQMDG